MNIFKKIKSFLFKDEEKKKSERYTPIDTCTITRTFYNIDQKVGLNFSSFMFIVDNNIFLINDRVESEIGIICRVLKTWSDKNNNIIEVQLETNIPEHYCPASELRSGKQWKVKERFFSEK